MIFPKLQYFSWTLKVVEEINIIRELISDMWKWISGGDQFLKTFYQNFFFLQYYNELCRMILCSFVWKNDVHVHKQN